VPILLQTIKLVSDLSTDIYPKALALKACLSSESINEIEDIFFKMNVCPLLMAQLMYGADFRKMEVHRLRINGIDFHRHQFPPTSNYRKARPKSDCLTILNSLNLKSNEESRLIQLNIPKVLIDNELAEYTLHNQLIPCAMLDLQGEFAQG